MLLHSRLRGLPFVATGVLIALVAVSSIAAHGTAPERPAAAVSFRFRLGGPDAPRLDPDRPDRAARTSAAGPLLVFLPATRAEPRDYTRFLSVATTAGFHVLGLDYGNLGPSLHRLCGPDPACYTAVQANRFDGSAPTPQSASDAEGSIRRRLVRSLDHLAEVDPAGGWGRYLRGDSMRWRRVVLAGHSQGGSESAYIAHRHRVSGVIMLGAPALSDGAAHASWLDEPSRTPSARFWAVAHDRDVLGGAIRPTWRALEVPGSASPFRSDGTETPPDAAHAVIADVPLPPGVGGHTAIARDDACAGLWRWALTAARRAG